MASATKAGSKGAARAPILMAHYRNATGRVCCEVAPRDSVTKN